MSEKRTVLASEFTEKSGKSEKTGKPWTRYALVDANGEIYSTFQNEVIAPIRGLSGQKVDIEFTVNGKYKNLESAAPHDNGGMPETYSHQKADGDADWDKVALGKTRCLLWAEYLGGHLASSVYIKASSAEGIEPRDAVLRTGLLLVVAAERDIFERPPGDDGIPL